ncbi:NAD-dependent epimerase/dehydratase [Syntrophobacter sp. SbD1]|nr:NAD-dependent epimerase/dehydratase [Syntrophobacter sp. SbD1]
MKIFVTGGTGFIGSYVTRRLSESGHEVLILTRSMQRAKESVPWATIVEGDPKKPGEWQQRVAETDAAINLAGSSIFTFWTDSARKAIVESRVLATRNLVDALVASGKEKILINASAVGYYGSRLDDEILSEEAPHGYEFMSQICVEWEDEAKKAAQSGNRVALCRFGIVLGRGGGALSMMTPVFRYMLGSSIGSGRQWMPWIHQEDLFNIISFLLSESGISGPVNCVSPNPVRNSEFARLLARTLGRPVVLPSVPAFLMRTILGEFSNVVLKGQRAVPKKLMETGFSFRFPTLNQALEDLTK